MKKLILISALISAFFLTISSTTESVVNNEKITICHIPPGNPENVHAITIDFSALNAHLAHGDSFGDCGFEAR